MFSFNLLPALRMLLLIVAAFVAQATITAQGASFSCPKITTIQGDMGIKTRFKGRDEDPTSSTLVPELVEEQAAVRSRINSPAKTVVNLSKIYLNNKSDNRVRDCLIRHVNSLADMNYLEGDGDSNMIYKSWMLSAININLLKMKDAGLGLEGKDKAYQSWAAKRAKEIADFYRPDCRNNHCYWGGVAVASTARYIDNKELSDFAYLALERAKANTDPQGWLPAELSRGKRSYHYTVFATAALVAQAGLLNDKNQETRQFLDGLVTKICAALPIVSSGSDFDQQGRQDLTGTGPYLHVLQAYSPTQCSSATNNLKGSANAFFLGWDLDYITALIANLHYGESIR